MQRPVMNPMIHGSSGDGDEFAGPPTFAQRRAKVFALVLRLLKRLVRLLLIRPFGARREKVRIEDASPAQRFLRGLTYRLAMMPVLLVLMIAALVWAGTHPPAVSTVSDPATQGIYFDPVTFLSGDGTRLEAWLVPLFDAKKINEEKEKALRRKQPAVVLVHDYGSSRASLLPLVSPLHESGMVVLAVALRGCGGSGSAAQTFGLNESHDVLAAVEMLRRRQFIDGQRIAVIGVGTGATAALLAAHHDPEIAAVVIENPVVDADQVIADRIGPKQGWLKSLRPMCKWAFEIACHVDAEELNFKRFADLMDSRPVHMVDADAGSPACVRPSVMKQIQYFLAKHLVTGETSVAEAGSGNIGNSQLEIRMVRQPKTRNSNER